ncbi:hypothetical protein Ahy_Scaffold1g106890 isoform D [Arachis hypogaea]|uniref:Uncharacterized protein n=1 Tax=Arachis hypogaea TaxID=3818 RepID=A0A444WT17_ARAHY|nr:hypothetical protein Ahy_Scaffold1g106890 isoform D [Arachis hypogaea]
MPLLLLVGRLRPPWCQILLLHCSLGLLDPNVTTKKMFKRKRKKGLQMSIDMIFGVIIFLDFTC